jgi:hypothetical protein
LLAAAVKGQVALQRGTNHLIPELAKSLAKIAQEGGSVKPGDLLYATAEEIVKILLVLLEATTDATSK